MLIIYTPADYKHFQASRESVFFVSWNKVVKKTIYAYLFNLQFQIDICYLLFCNANIFFGCSNTAMRKYL